MNIDKALNNTNEDVEMECNGYLTRCTEGNKATDVRLAAIAIGTLRRGGLGKLSIRGNNFARGVSNHGLSSIARGRPSLRVLSLWNVPSIGNEVLIEIAREFHSLEKLDLFQCPSITNTGLAAIAEKCPNLTALTVESSPQIGNESLQALAKGCPNLKQMCLKKCCFVSDNGLVAFAKAAKSLESLQLEEHNRITQIWILNAILSSNSKLKSVSLVKCMGIKDLSMEFPILSPCESLRCLSIRSCPGFGSTSLAMVGKLCPNLHHLDLRGLCGIPDNGLLPLLECCEAGLAKVHLSDCLNLTDEVILALARLHGERILAFPASFGQILTKDLIDTNLLCSGTKMKKETKKMSIPLLCHLGRTKMVRN